MKKFGAVEFKEIKERLDRLEEFMQKRFNWNKLTLPPGKKTEIKEKVIVDPP